MKHVFKHTDIDQRIGIVELFSGRTADGSPFYAYLSIPPSKYEAFRKHQAGQSLKITDFGEIIAAGWGAEPPPEAREEMEKTHGVRHDLEARLTAAAKAAADTAEAQA